MADSIVFPILQIFPFLLNVSNFPKSFLHLIKMATVFNKSHYDSDQGMLTNVWGPALWHVL
ncbi:MAG: hypothetical protein ACTSW1_06115, partial [Candidatus Hodarchaeales archaeon]